MPAGRGRRLDGDRRARVLGLQADAELRQRAEQRADGAALEVLLPRERDRLVGQRRQADHEVERRARAADGDRLAGGAVRAAVDDEARVVLLDARAEPAQHLDGRTDMPRARAADDARRAGGQRREHERAMRVVLRARDVDRPTERLANLADEQMHGAGTLAARAGGVRPRMRSAFEFRVRDAGTYRKQFDRPALPRQGHPRRETGPQSHGTPTRSQPHHRRSLGSSRPDAWRCPRAPRLSSSRRPNPLGRPRRPGLRRPRDAPRPHRTPTR